MKYIVQVDYLFKLDNVLSGCMTNMVFDGPRGLVYLALLGYQLMVIRL